MSDGMEEFKRLLGHALTQHHRASMEGGEAPEAMQACIAHVRALYDRVERAEDAIKGCPYGPCPTLARLGLEDMEDMDAALGDRTHE